MTLMFSDTTKQRLSFTSESQQFLSYTFVGVLNATICLITYGIFVLVFQASFWVGNFAAFISSVSIGFLLSRRFVFKTSNRTITSESWRYFSVVFLQFLLGTTLIGVFVSYETSEVLSYILTMPFVVLISFLMQKYWTFKSLNISDEASGIL